MITINVQVNILLPPVRCSSFCSKCLNFLKKLLGCELTSFQLTQEIFNHKATLPWCKLLRCIVFIPVLLSAAQNNTLTALKAEGFVLVWMDSSLTLTINKVLEHNRRPERLRTRLPSYGEGRHVQTHGVWFLNALIQMTNPHRSHDVMGQLVMLLI